MTRCVLQRRVARQPADRCGRTATGDVEHVALVPLRTAAAVAPTAVPCPVR